MFIDKSLSCGLMFLLCSCIGAVFIPMLTYAGPPTDQGFEARAQWLIDLFKDQKIRGSAKTGLPDAYGRLVASHGEDAEAKAYLAKHPNSPNAMFDYPWVVKALYGYGEHFTQEQIAQIRTNLTNQDDWLTHWTENHAIKRVTSGYLAAQYFPDAKWKWREQGGKEITSQELMAQAKRQLISRGQGFLRVGNNEQLSPTYAALNAASLLALYDYAKDPEVRAIADGLLMYHMATLAANNFDGYIVPPLNRRAPQMRFENPKNRKRDRYFTAIVHPVTWLLWGHNQIAPEDILWVNEPAYVLCFATTTWRVPAVINRIAQGEVEPYELRSWIGKFGPWGDARDWETLRYMYRGSDYALGFTVAQRYSPEAHFNDYDTTAVVWKSKNQFRQLEIFHPYFRSNRGANYRQELTSPFMQSTGDKSTLLVMFNIPQADPWPNRGAKHWLAERNKQFDQLHQVALARFPASVEELVEHEQGYFFREGPVYVGVRPMRAGHTLERGPADWFHTIRSGAAQTGFVIEVGTADQFPTLTAFQKSVLANPLEVNWTRLEAKYRNSAGHDIRMTMYPARFAPDDKEYLIQPIAAINNRMLDQKNWPVFESPYVNMDGKGVLVVGQGGERIVVDWRGRIPVIDR